MRRLLLLLAAIAAMTSVARAETGGALLLEASPVSAGRPAEQRGEVVWSRGSDEKGEPTLAARVVVAGRDLAVDLLIRRNHDETIPATHFIEVVFNQGARFVGGVVAQMPGVLLKDEELDQGDALRGATARVVANTFLFALSAAPDDYLKNALLMMRRDWIDLALVYGNGRRAIVTLRKDDTADTLMHEIFLKPD